MADSPQPVSQALAWAQAPLEDFAVGCTFVSTTGTGPGGQRRNRVRSVCVAEHVASGIAVRVEDQREGGRNKAIAVQRLRLKVAVFSACSAVIPDSVSDQTALLHSLQESVAAAWRPRVNSGHFDFAVLAQCLLVSLRLAGGLAAPAAAMIGVSGSAFTRFLSQEKSVWSAAQGLRGRFGLPPLRSR